MSDLPGSMDGGDHPGTTPVRPEVSSDAGWRWLTRLFRRGLPQPTVKLQHAQYPDTMRPGWVQRSEHASVRSAVDYVHDFYKGKRGWWYQVFDHTGFELYSTDHEIAGYPIPPYRTTPLAPAPPSGITTPEEE